MGEKRELTAHLNARVRKLESMVCRNILGWNFFDSGEAALLDQDAQEHRYRRSMLISIGLFFVWLALGTGVNFWLHDLPDTDWDGSRLVKGFYFSVVTLTTIGLGDFSPTTWQGKLFDIFYIITGVPICVNALSQLVEAIWGTTEEPHKIDLVQGLTEGKLQTMLKFQEEMARAGCTNVVDSKVSEYEFLLFVLTKNGIVEMDMVSQIMRNFKKLDDTHNGFLDISDVVSSSSQSHSPQVCPMSPHSSHGGA